MDIPYGEKDNKPVQGENKYTRLPAKLNGK